MEILIKNLSVRKSHRQILSDISLILKPGIYAVVGEKNSGKTTFLRSILGLQKYEGIIFQNTCKWEPMSYLPQEFKTLKRHTVRQAKRVGCCFKGIPQKNGEPDFAQTLAGDWKLLALDEPLAGMKEEYRREFLQMISDAQKEDPERILLIASEDANELSMVCEKVIWLRDGRMEAYENMECFINKQKQM